MNLVKRVVATLLGVLVIMPVVALLAVTAMVVLPIAPVKASPLTPNTDIEGCDVLSYSVSDAGLAYEPTEATGMVLPDDRSLGDEVAWLAVQMAATASPDSRPTNPSHNVWEKIDDQRLANEFAVMDALEEVCPEFNCAYASCNQAACAVLSAVVDMDMTPHDNASGGPPTMLEWLRSHPENWQRIDSHDEEDLLPGDVICGPGHTAIYVGHDIPQGKFPGTTGSMYEASYSAAAYAGIDGFWIAGDAEVYRPVKRNDSPGFRQIDYHALVAANQD